jgi:3-hydroxyacyl-CoA dehydrogenase/enoyl-CoA hydratase/3-hydroxybutyryl-CoA epimerase
MFDGLRPRHWQSERRPDGIVVLTLDRADQGVNALSREVLDELGALIERIAIEKPKAVVFRSGKAAGFIPGADIKTFEELDKKDLVYDWLRLASSCSRRLPS